MFGTDYLMPGQQVPQLSMYREIELPVAQEKVFGRMRGVCLGCRVGFGFGVGVS